MNQGKPVPSSLMLEEDMSGAGNDVELISRRRRRVIWLGVRDGRKVVLKGLPEQLRSHPEETASLRKEYLLGLRIESEGVVRVYGFEQHPRLGPVIVMEYVDGMPLNDFLEPDGEGSRAGLRERRQMAFEIADAIASIHRSGVAHRDLKPDNILVTARDHSPKIIDFGNGDREEFVIYKDSLATEQYGAPEQQAPSAAGMGSDIYSFGKILDDLLPERRFRRIRKACKADDSALRPAMEKVAQWLDPSAARNKRRIVISSIAAGIFLILAVAISSVFWSRSSESERAGRPEAVEAAHENAPAPVALPSKAAASGEPAATLPGSPGREMESRPSVGIAPDIAAEGKKDDSSVGVEEMDEVIQKYIKEADKINARYGALRVDTESKENDRLRLRRGDEHFKLADRMERELKALGLDEVECGKASHILWTHIIFETNRIDGVDELRDKYMKTYGLSSESE